MTSETNPAGLADGSRWSARLNRADHRVNASELLHPEGVPAPLPAHPRLFIPKRAVDKPQRTQRTQGRELGKTLVFTRRVSVSVCLTACLSLSSLRSLRLNCSV